MADALKNFCESYGLKINMGKSKAIAPNGVFQDIREEIHTIASICLFVILANTLGFRWLEGASFGVVSTICLIISSGN